MPQSPPELPDHLTRYVVEQDYSQYDAADQATWRFVMLHLYDHLRQHAHPSYTKGLPGTGLSVDHIPRVSEVDAALKKLGWRAVAITGFIPPRAFQDFQAAGVLPIATEIRSPEHLAYTPAPDIIHEAAGHAPILINQQYAEYLKRVGEVGKLAFSCPEDHEVYQAIAHLSVVKEQPAATAEQQLAAEQRLASAVSAQTQTSEATRIARLYWWTAEYGLIGTPRDYRLYGAGLLSSLGEAHYCRRDEVRKLPLSVACLDVDYDITRPQPQLFVARDFEHLSENLSEAEAQLAAVGSRHHALTAAVNSRLPARVQLGVAGAIIGRLLSFAVGNAGSELLTFSGRCQLEGFPRTEVNPTTASNAGVIDDYVLPLGAVQAASLGGKRLRVHLSGLTPLSSASLPAAVHLEYESGLEASGRMIGVSTSEDGRPTALYLSDAKIKTPSGERHFEHYVLPIEATVSGVLPADEEMSRSVPTRRKAPAPRQLTPKQARLRELYAEATQIWQDRAGGQARDLLTSIHRQLQDFPDDWLLRWNLLESLLKLGAVNDTSALFRELEELEVRHAHQQPIATGLRSLRQLGQSQPPQGAQS